MAEISGPPSFQPKPLDDEWSKWLVGEWKGIVGLGGVKSEAWREIGRQDCRTLWSLLDRVTGENIGDGLFKLILVCRVAHA